MGPRLIRFVYQKLGYRYVLLVLVGQYLMTCAIVFGSVVLLSNYQQMSDRQFWWMVAWAQVMALFDRLLSMGPAISFLKPLKRWFSGERGPQIASDAWHAIIDLPSDFLKRWGVFSPLFNIVPFALGGTFILKLSLIDGAVLLAAGSVMIIYGVVLRYFATELALRPLLEDLADELPDDFDLGRPMLPLKRKILLVIPIISFVTGIVIAALTSQQQETLSDLGFDLMIALAVSLTIALEIAIVLSRSVVTPIRQIRAATNRVTHGDLSVTVPVITNDEAGQLAQSFNEMVVGLRERERLHDALEIYVNPEVADRVTEKGAVREGDVVDVTVVFIDILNFTALAERIGARAIVGYLNEFYELVVPIVTEHEGDPNKFIGDGLLAVFGAPNKIEDHADKAVKAGLKIIEGLRDAYGDRVQVGIGICSGPVLAGTIGGGGRLDYTVIGDTVNTASRIEELTRETGDPVLITDSTKNLLTDSNFVVEQRLSAMLKGKREAVDVFAVSL